jgi:hypothetical protein
MGSFEFYFRPKRWEKNGTFYKCLGVLIFKRFIVKLGRKVGQDKQKNGNYFLGNKNIEGLKRYEQQTRNNELMHLPGLVFSVAGLFGTTSVFITLICWFVLIINFHPYILQRHNRCRIYKLLNL